LPRRSAIGHGRIMANPEDIETVVIIGAGLAGLTAGYVFSRKGFRPRILERELQVGIPWSRRHPQLTLNTHRTVSHLPGLNYPPGTGAFPKREAVVAHLAEFATLHDMPIEYGVDVQRVTREGANFCLQTSAGQIVTKNVVIAVGRDGLPSIPAWEGAEVFSGRIIHAADFGDALEYTGKSVLVVGGGNSGFDVLNHLSRVETKQVWLSMRSGAAVLPKRLKGFAVHRLSPIIDAVPTRVADAAISLTQWLAFGSVQGFGFPPPRYGAATRLASENVAIPVDDGAMTAIRSGRIQIVGDVAKFEHHQVFTAGGKAVSPDIVVAATGYTSRLQDLFAEEDIGLDRKNTPTEISGMWFIGMKPSLVSYFHNALKEAVRISGQLRP
jgi:cation diffusion facilitator CzcD-associated flavoprotein CzcO